MTDKAQPTTTTLSSGQAPNTRSKSQTSTPRSSANPTYDKNTGSFTGPSSPRLRLAQINDALEAARPDHLCTSEFWKSFVLTNFSRDAQLRIRLAITTEQAGKQSNEGTAIASGLNIKANYEFKGQILIAAFFEKWGLGGMLSRMHFEFPKAVEMNLANGFSLIGSLRAQIETVLGEDALLVRQKLRARIMFDSVSQIHLMELHFLPDHQEYFLSKKSIAMLTRNFPNLTAASVSLGHEPLLRWGFPLSLLRFLDLYLVMSSESFLQSLDQLFRHLGTGGRGTSSASQSQQQAVSPPTNPTGSYMMPAMPVDGSRPPGKKRPKKKLSTGRSPSADTAAVPEV